MLLRPNGPFVQDTLSAAAICSGCCLRSVSLGPSNRDNNLSFLCMAAQLLSHVRCFYDPVDCSPPGSSAHGIFQARILEWVAISSSRGSSRPRDQTRISCISCTGRWILGHCTTWQAPLTSAACIYCPHHTSGTI